jgi:hypothetical protein
VKAVVFAGPSLSGPALEGRPEIEVRPPAKQGDVYRASLLRPRVIGIIDGYFEDVPSVWHKEILWALSQGIHVFGSASMGALRAAELDVFGMVGIGSIYEQYRDGGIEDDDEVALVHGPTEAAFVPLSEPMVNMRATIANAVRAGVIEQPLAEAIATIAKSLHYKERQWRKVLEKAGAGGLEAGSICGFAAWLKAGKVDQKRLDAEALIAAVSSALDEQTAPFEAQFRFEWTELWDRVVREWDEEALSSERPGGLEAAVLDELRLDPERYVTIRTQAVQRAVLLRHRPGRRSAIDRATKLKHLGRLRERLALLRKADLDRWMDASGLTPGDVERLVEEEALVEGASELDPALVDAQILALLHLGGDYPRLAERARRKIEPDRAAALAEEAAPRLPPPVLLNWYFGQRLRQPVPDDLDGYLARLGLASRQAFYRLLAAEYVHSKANGDR